MVPVLTKKTKTHRKSADLSQIVKGLKKAYPRVHCALDHRNPFDLLVSTILSAQCTDERVNLVTPALFKKYPTPEALAKASLPSVEALIHSTGFYHQKAKSLVFMARGLVENHSGQVPKNMTDLTALRGVARKTANVVLGSAYGIASGIVVDTHVTRLSQRMGFTKQQDPVKIERELMARVPQKDWIWFSHALITHGRKVCKARTPNCPECPVNEWCPFPARKK